MGDLSCGRLRMDLIILLGHTNNVIVFVCLESPYTVTPLALVRQGNSQGYEGMGIRVHDQANIHQIVLNKGGGNCEALQAGLHLEYV